MHSQNVSAKEKRKLEFPHVLILLSLMVLVACLLTYIVPAGKYDIVPNTKMVDPNSFHYVENTPVSPWQAFIGIQGNIVKSGLVIALLLILGASTEILISSGAIQSLVEAGIHRYKDKSIIVVIPTIYALMSLLGALCGNDSMIAYVAIGVVIAQRLKLDRICAVAMFYLAYIMGQSCGPTTAIILTAQGILGLQPLTGAFVRIVIWIIFTSTGAIYTTLYALKINRDPNRSILDIDDCFTQDVDTSSLDNRSGKFEYRALFSVLSVIACYFIFAYGARAYKWSWNMLTACIMLSSIIIAILYRYSPNKFARTAFVGAKNMGGICLLLGIARTISATLTDGNVIHTIAHSTIQVIGDFGAAFGALGLFVFNLLFNFLVPSGTTQAAIVLPVTMPIGDVMGITRQVMGLVLQLGDGLTNCLTPLSAVLMSAIAFGGVVYTKWIKYALPIVVINVVIGGIFIVGLQTIGWM